MKQDFAMIRDWLIGALDRDKNALVIKRDIRTSKNSPLNSKITDIDRQNKTHVLQNNLFDVKCNKMISLFFSILVIFKLVNV